MITEEIKMEGAHIVCRNFAGKKTDFNAEGDRNFGVLLDDTLAAKLEHDGWNIKMFKPKPDDPNQYRQPWLKVKVKYGKFPPIANLITVRGRTRLDENTIGQLDWTRIKNVDLIIRPYNYPASNFSPAGVAAYLKAIYVTVLEDDFAIKYADIPEINYNPTVTDEYD